MANPSAAARVIQQRLKDRKLPAVEVPAVDNPELARSIQSIQEHFRMYEGDSGAPKERFVTMAELERAGMIQADVKSGFAYISRVLSKDVAQQAGSTANPTLVDPVKKDTSRQSRIPASGGGGGGQQPVAMAMKIGAAEDVSVAKPTQADFMYYDGGEWTNFPLFARANRWQKQQVYDKPFQMLSQAATPEALPNYGFLWTKDDDPTTLWFTDSDGTEAQVAAGGSGLDAAADENISGQWDFLDKVRIILTGGTAADMLHLRDDTDGTDFVFHYDGAHWALRSEAGGAGSKFLGFNSSSLAADFGGAISTPVAVTASGGFYVDSKSTDPASGSYVRMMMTGGAGYIDAYDFGGGGFDFDLNIRANATKFSQGTVDIDGVLTTSANAYFGGDAIGHFETVSAHYGSVQVDGAEGSNGGYSGYSIGGRHVFMDDGGSTWGLYNDNNNQWAMLFVDGGAADLRYAGSVKLATTSGGVDITGALAATSFGGITSANLVDKTAVEAITETWSFGKLTAAIQLLAGDNTVTFEGAQIHFGFQGNANYRHGIGTRHNGAADADNAIDFYLWQFGDTVGNLGTYHVFGLESTGSFVASPLDVQGALTTDSVTIGDGDSADEDLLIHFNIDRAWKFLATGTDASTQLTLRSLGGGGKIFDIQDDSSVTQFTFATASGNFDAVGAITGASFGGITSANLLDKTASEVISGASWTFDDTNIGKAAHTIVTLVTGEWDKVEGFAAMIHQNSTGVPVANHGYWHILGRRDTGGGYGGLYQEYSNGTLYSGYNTTGSDPNWKEIAFKDEVWHAGNDGDGSGLDADSVGAIPNTNLMTFTGAQIPVMTDIDDTNVGSTSIGQVMYWDGSLWQPAWAYDLAASLVSQAEAEANAATTIRWWSSLRVGQAVVSAKTISTLWRFTYPSEPAPSALQSTLTANFLHVDGKEAIDGNDAWLRLNANAEFASGIYVIGHFRVDGSIEINAPMTMDASNFTMNGGELRFDDANCYVKEGASDQVRLGTSFGYMDIGPTNSSWCHMNTDRAAFYVGDAIHFGGVAIKYLKGSMLYHKSSGYSTGEITFSTSSASGGSNGDIWFKYT